ncbi:DUF5719 family protein [Microbacterium oleivorans]|uniref:Large extracellular alpha-helical protein n=1 Tax=Microbacterium oleivorans TaxID=273677 RepID=A0A7D5J099_9MICO|nr:DUF5719 family protein [Microbacterium oleivorans]QLD12575.1 large extracellular alpha-helical protein [Microbacterium oleivorans]
MSVRPALTRAVIGVVTAVIVGGGVAAAAVAPWPTLAREPLGLQVVPEAARSVAACDGPLLALGRDETAAGAITEAAGAAVTAQADGSEPTESAITTPDRADAGSAPAVFTAEPIGGRPTDLAAASVSLLDEPDLRGLAVSNCSRPVMESWIVGGSAATGASDLVLLANPGAVPATVNLRIYGAEGAADPVAGSEIVVAARSQRIVPLAALQRGEESPVVRMTATGAPIRASLQSALTRTLIAGGVDQVSAAAPPATTQIIPAVDVTVAPDSGASAGGMSVRLLAPAVDTTASVVVRSADDGTVVSQQEGIALAADRPLELEVTGMPVGAYTVTATAPEPVVAAAWTSTDLAGPADFAWAVAAPAVDAPTTVAIAAGPNPTLALSAAADATVVVTPLAGGASQSIDLTAGQSRTVEVSAGAVYRIDPGAGVVHASVGFSAAGQLGTYPVTGSAAAAAELTVYP